MPTMLLETVTVTCPYCWQAIEIVVDVSALPSRLTEDCSVCCHPMLLNAWRHEDGTFEVAAAREND